MCSARETIEFLLRSNVSCANIRRTPLLIAASNVPRFSSQFPKIQLARIAMIDLLQTCIFLEFDSAIPYQPSHRCEDLASFFADHLIAVQLDKY